MAFHSRKLNPAQTRCAAGERELLSAAETLKEHRNMLLGQQIEVFTDHKNPVHKHFNAERVVRWRLLPEEFGPKLTHVKGTNDIVVDALSRLETERCKTSSGRNPNCGLRSHMLSQTARVSSLPRMTRFAFPSCCNTSVPNGVTQR